MFAIYQTNCIKVRYAAPSPLSAPPTLYPLQTPLLDSVEEIGVWSQADVQQIALCALAQAETQSQPNYR